MYINRKSKNPRRFPIFVDIVHIVICILIAVLTVMLFLNPEKNQILFPAVFFLATILNAVSAAVKWKAENARGGHLVSAIFFGIIAVLLFVLTIVSAMSVWRF